MVKRTMDLKLENLNKGNLGVRLDKRGGMYTYAKTLAEELGDVAKDIAVKETLDLSMKYVNSVKMRIWRQEFKWAPLSKDYADFKRRTGLDPRILVATKEYVRSIQIIKVAAKKKFTYKIGLPDRQRADGGPSLAKLARWHEYGTRSGLPARPHWRPTLERMRDEERKALKRIVAQTNKRLKRRMRNRVRPRKGK